MAMDSTGDLANAIEDFHRARNRADLRELLARLTGDSNQLLSYDEVRTMLRLKGAASRGVQEIPLNAIVGSVGRYTDFTRDFLPRREVNAERWARVKLAASGYAGLPPIDVYKIGDVYFVQDGNHRVSVARQLGSEYIQAYVTEVYTHIPLTKDTQPDDLIRKAEYSQFLEKTSLDRLRPDSDLSATIPGQYPILLEHIDVHRYFMGIDFQRSITYEEAVLHWYDVVYSPVVEIIRTQGMLRWFPGRTETDLYLWIAEHRSELEDEFGFPVRAETVFEHLVEDYTERWISRVGGKLLNLVIPDGLEGGPPIGRWRDQVEIRRDNRLFIEILVPINGKEDGWCALEQALEVATREQAILHGLHVVPSDPEEDAGLSELQDRFDGLCRAKNIQGSLVITKGEVVEQTSIRAAATDLVVVNLSYPPGERPISRLNSGFRNLLHRSPRPVLATPQTVSQLNHGLLAFDGSAQAHEALFVATYLARQWSIRLDVVSVEDGKGSGEKTLEQARIYLEDHHVSARYFLEIGDPGEALLLLASAEDCDLIIMGSYSLKPVLEVVLGSTVDKVLRGSKTPTLICR